MLCLRLNPSDVTKPPQSRNEHLLEKTLLLFFLAFHCIFLKWVFWKRQISRFSVWTSDSALVQKLPVWKAFSNLLFYWQFNCTLSGSVSSTLLQLVQHQKLIFFPNSWLLYLFCPLRGSCSLVCWSTAVWKIAYKWFLFLVLYGTL